MNVLCRCRNTHDIKAYLASKPKDLRFPPISALSSEPPFVKQVDEDQTMEDAENLSVDFSTTCPIFERTGECKHGLRCRYLGGHVRKKEEGEMELVVDEEKKARSIVAETELNFVTGDTLKQIRSKKVCIHALWQRAILTVISSSHIQLLTPTLKSFKKLRRRRMVRNPNSQLPQSLSKQAQPPLSPLQLHRLLHSQKQHRNPPRTARTCLRLIRQMCLSDQLRRSGYTGRGRRVSAVLPHHAQNAEPNADLAPLTTVGNLVSTSCEFLQNQY